MQCVGFRVWNLGSGVWGFTGLRELDLVSGSSCGVWGAGFGGWSVGICTALSIGFRGFQVSGSGFEGGVQGFARPGHLISGCRCAVSGPGFVRVVHLGRSTCYAISGRGG